MTDLAAIQTIVIVMLENRSFDHILGHLSLPDLGNGTAVDGLKAPLQQEAYENLFEGESYFPFHLKDHALSSDLPHERRQVRAQLALSPVTQAYTMGGFAGTYFEATPTNRTTTPDPMGFFGPEDVPITRFFADNFAVCDRWFAPLPTSTQPNRIMALCGSTRTDQTKGLFPPTDTILLEWLSARNVRWRVYHSGISFFALLGRLEIFGPSFRGIDRLAADVAHEGPDDFPQVIIVEPSYADAPHLAGDVPNDNHPPLPVLPGEALLLNVYNALTCNPDRWASTLLIVTYDEHGGFFDHVVPEPVPYRPASNAIFTDPFSTTGVRVPSLIVSPFVDPQTVYSGVLDHTSILQLLAERFTPGTGHSGSVDQRKAFGIRSVREALNRDSPRTDIPQPPSLRVQVTLELGAPRPPQTPMQLAFANAAARMVQDHPRETAQKYPEVSHWVLAQQQARGQPDV
jgi:phospholipase C